MQVREVNVTDADGKSAQLFFDALTGFYDLSQARALDMFARNGQLTVKNYVSKVKAVDAWELNGEHEEALRSIDPTVSVKIDCSYLSATLANGKYDLVVIDSPQGAHRDFSKMVCFEHFTALTKLRRLAADRSIVVLYVNKEPYDKAVAGDHGYDQYEEYDFKAWMAAREDFYGFDPRKLTDGSALFAYDRAFRAAGFKVVNTVVVPCYSDVPRKENYAFRVGFEVIRS
jgi:predicted RNA methylase